MKGEWGRKRKWILGAVSMQTSFELSLDYAKWLEIQLELPSSWSKTEDVSSSKIYRVKNGMCQRYAENALLKAGRIFSHESLKRTTLEPGTHWQALLQCSPSLAMWGSNTSPFWEEAGLAKLRACPSQAHKENGPIQKTVGPMDPSNKPGMSSSQFTWYLLGTYCRAQASLGTGDKTVSKANLMKLVF